MQLPCLEEVQFCAYDLNYVLYAQKAGIMRLATVPTLKTIRAYGQAVAQSIGMELKKQMVPPELLAKFVFVRTEEDERRWVQPSHIEQD